MFIGISLWRVHVDDSWHLPYSCCEIVLGSETVWISSVRNIQSLQDISAMIVRVEIEMNGCSHIVGHQADTTDRRSVQGAVDIQRLYYGANELRQLLNVRISSAVGGGNGEHNISTVLAH